MAMDARKQRILEAIVALYANDGEPVGSGLLANYFDMALSSATLRNEMAALTKLGLLEQPHTSAGRVPSAQGYRYYLDHLIDAPKSGTLPEKDRRRIDDLFAAMDAEPEKLVPAATRCLADMTGSAASSVFASSIVGMIAWWSDTFLLSNTFAIPGVKPTPAIKGSFSQSSVIMPAAVSPMSSVRKLLSVLG